MASVVFLRGVNVGGARVFQPSVLARKLSHLGAINVGAAGTFVIEKAIAATALRAELLKRLPFEPEIMVCPGRDLLALSHDRPLPGEPDEDVRRFVHVMSKRPRQGVRLPILEPAGDRWEVKVVEVKGRIALSFWRRLRSSFLDPNGVVEKQLGVKSTTRNWTTIDKIREILLAL